MLFPGTKIPTHPLCLLSKFLRCTGVGFERTMAQYTAHLGFMERCLLSQTHFLSLLKNLKEFDFCVFSYSSSLFEIVYLG